MSEAVSADSTRLAIPVDSLLRLPAGAKYTSRSGRAHVSATVSRGPSRPATLLVESGCDSLERLCLYYQEENERLTASATREKNERHAEVKEQASPLRKAAETFIAGAIAGAILTIITRKICHKVF